MRLAKLRRRTGRLSLSLTRRLIERGVLFVQVWHGKWQPGDNHDEIEKTTASWRANVRKGSVR